MGKSFRKLMPLWVTYIVLFVLALMGPLLQGVGGLARGHWAFLFLLPLALGIAPYSFILGEVIQRRSRATSRSITRLSLLHTVVIYAVFIISIFDFILASSDILYLAVWTVPSILSGLLFALGASVMRREQAHSDMRYGVEIRRGDPWSSFFDLKWDDDSHKDSGYRGARRPDAVRRAEEQRFGRSRRRSQQSRRQEQRQQ